MTPLIAILTSPVFCNVTFLVVVVCRFWLPKLIEEGLTCKESMTFSATPAREMAGSDCGALLVMVREAETFPGVVGVKAKV